MLRYLLAFLLLPANVFADSSATLCKKPEGMTAKAVVLLSHGLNHDPNTLAPLRESLQKNGFATCQLRLSAHDGIAESKHIATKELWLADFDKAYAKLEKEFPEIPRYTIGYSLGAACTILYLENNKEASFDKMIFLAPAFALNWNSTLLRVITPLRHLNVSLPSFSLKQYRVYSSTSLSSYRATLDIVDEIENISNSNKLKTIPTEIYLSKEDEMVSPKGIENWLKQNNLKNWQLNYITPKPTLKNSYNHLIIDKASLGPSLWERFQVLFIEKEALL